MRVVREQSLANIARVGRSAIPGRESPPPPTRLTMRFPYHLVLFLGVLEGAPLAAIAAQSPLVSPADTTG